MNTRPFCVWFAFLVLLGTGTSALAEEPAPEAPVARVVMREWTDYEDFTGRTEAAARVELRARVTGYLVKALAEQSGEVKQGDVLFEIDSRPYRAELDRAEAAVKLAEAHLRLAEANYKRAKTLLDQKSIGPEELERATAERDVGEAGIRAAQAVRAAARLNLDFTRVVAPITGRIGWRTVDPGNLVKADETILATLVRRDPLYVFFDIDERSALQLLRSQREGKGKAEKTQVAVGLAGEEGFPRRGELDFTDNQLNPNTGTLRMRAVLPNKDGLLLPGLFARVRLAMGAPHKVLMVPEQAIMVEEGQRFVYVVNDRDVIEQRAVTVGQGGDGLRAVTRGLKENERVITGRLQKLQPGMSVRPREGEKPAPKEKSSPGNGPASAAPSLRGQAGPGILVQAVYPGASAQVVSETVRSPIEQQINGVEKLRFMRSRCTSDGRYALSLAFARGANLQVMQVLVQNRVSLAMPTLPSAAIANDVSVKRGSSGAWMILNLSSPDRTFDRRFLSNYANIWIKDELGRLPGVADVAFLGESDFRLRVWLDADKLAAHSLNSGEVMATIEKQKEPGGLDEEKLSDLIVKADGEGRVVRLKDVANLEIGAGTEGSRASFNGEPVVSLVVRHTGEVAPRKMRKALEDTVSQLRERLPKGLDLAVSFDFTTDAENLLLDLDLPAAVSTEHVWQVLNRCQALLRPLPEVQDVLAMSENPFDVFGGGPCLLVALTPADKRKAGREEIARALRRKLDEIKELSVRVRDLSGASRSPNFGYPIDLAVCGPDAGRVREFAKQLAARLGRDGQLTDVWVNPDSEPRVQRTVDIDRTAAAARGLSVGDILATLRVHGGAICVNDFVRFGRAWRVQVQTEPGAGDWIKDLHRLKVRSAQGQMIPLSAVVRVRDTEAPLALDFLDFWSMVEITANPASGVKLEEARKRCEKLAEEIRKEMHLPAAYRTLWLP